MAVTVVDAALDYAARGWRVVPIIPGGKRPPMAAWQTHATTAPVVIERWWGRDHPDCGIGIATGESTGLWVLDVDGDAGADSLADLEATHGPLPDTVEVVTGSGGRHLYFAWPDDGTTIRNDQAGRLGVGLDVRGEGGQVVAPPTVHPSGRRYEWESSSHPDDVTVAQAPEWLISLLRSAPDPATAVRTKAPRPDGDLPGDRFAAQVSWPELLEADGAVYLGRRVDHVSGEPYELWGRPPYPGEENYTPHTSATLYYRGSDVLKVFSPNWRGVDEVTGELWALDVDATYTRFGYWTARHFGGDHSAAASHLARLEGDEAIEEIVAGPPREPTQAPEAVDAPWPDPQAIEAAIDAGPPFPLEVLPEWIADVVEDTRVSFQVPADLPASLALGALSAVCMGKIRTHVTGSRWTEETNLYLVVAMPPGAGKSPVVKVLTAPLVDLEQEWVRYRSDDRIRAESRRDNIEARLSRARQAMKKGDADHEALIDEVTRLRQELERVETPPSGHLLADDSTPEALAEKMSQRDGLTAIVSAESNVFEQMGGIYADHRANLDVYLKSWSADPIIIDRKSGSISIPRPLLTICVTTQPSALRQLGADDNAVGRGATARFMYSIPRSMVGRRDRRAVLRDAQTDAVATYQDRLRDIGRRVASWATTVDLDLAIDARERFLDWDQALEDRLRAGQDLADVSEWASKVRASALRVAALLHVADGGRHDEEIDDDTMSAALVIADYWISHAQVVHSTWMRSAVEDRASRVLDWLEERGEREFKATELQVEMRGTFDRIESVVEPLELLVHRGWVRAVDGLPIEVGRRGKPSPRLVVHPDLPRWVAKLRKGDLVAVYRTRETSEGSPSDPDEVSRVSRVSRKGVLQTPPPPPDGRDGDGVDATRNPRNPRNPDPGSDHGLF